MRMIIAALILLSLVANAAVDQHYEQTLKRDGTSTIVKSMEINIFAADLDERALEKISDTCNTSQRIRCSVEGQTITIEDDFSPGNYYIFKTEHGLTAIEYTLTVNKIPTDRFSMLLEELLDEAEVVESTGGSADPLDLLDKEGNAESVYFLKRFEANITYSVNMPVAITEAGAGGVNATVLGERTVRFDLVDIMEEGQPITVKSQEMNVANIILVVAVIVLGALAYSFFRQKPKKKKKK